MKTYIKVIVALTIGLICGAIIYLQDSGSGKNFEPITISLDCANAKSGIQFYYTTGADQQFNNEQVVNTGEITDEKHLEIPLEIESLNKLKIGFGKAPGVVTLKNITIAGDKAVRIKDFNNADKNDIDEFYWNGDTVYVNSSKENPFISFQKPFNIGAKATGNNAQLKGYEKAAVVFCLTALIAFLALFLMQRNAKWKQAIAAVAVGLICGIVTYARNSGPENNLEPITISLDCSNAKDGVKFYYTTEEGQDFSSSQVVGTGEITDEEHLEFPIEAKSLHKLKLSLGKMPGVVTLKNITITGDRVVKISDFNNTEKNDIEEFYWNVDTVYVRSAKENAYVAFQTPFNIGAKASNSNIKVYVKTAIAFCLGALIVLLAFFMLQRTAKKKNTDVDTLLKELWESIVASFKSGLNFLKVYIKEVAALAIGLACAIGLYVHYSASEEEMDPISISFDSSSIVGGVQIFYTTEDGQEFSSSRMVSANNVHGESHLEFLISEKALQKMRIDLGSCPGVFKIENFTIKGDKTVRITNFDNTEQHQIDEYYWNENKVFIKSLEDDPYIIFQTPFNVKAESNHTRTIIKSMIAFFAISLIIYLIVCTVVRLISKDSSSFKRVYVISMVLIAGIISCVVAKALSEKVGSYYQKQISLKADVKAQTPFYLSYFYTTTPAEEFSDDKRLDVLINPGDNATSIQMPTSHLEKLRVDFGTNPGAVEFKNFTIQGSDNIVVSSDDYNNSTKNEFEECNIVNDGVVTKSVGQDPFIAFNRDFNINGTKCINIDKVIFATILLTIFALLSLLVKMTSKYVEGKNAEDLILVIIFIATCIAPTFFLTDKTISESEKRTLAEFPIVSDSVGFNSSFSTQFDSWYSDHFAKRDEIVGLNNAIFLCEGDAQNDDVIEGKDGWLFYKSDKSIENFTNTPLITDEELPLIKAYLQTINNWCNAHGKKFYFLICPNKATIYGENMKHIKKLQGDENSDAMRVINYLKGSEIKAVFSKDEIMKHKNDGQLLYFKQDTHHSEIGAYYSYKAVMDLISKDFPITATPLSSIPKTLYKDVDDCDLKKMMPGAIKDDTCLYQHLAIDKTKMVGGGDLVSFSMTNPEAAGKLYLLGDSFSSALQMLFATNFNIVNANRIHQYWFPDEEIDKLETSSDVVVLEVVQRHLHLLSHQKVSPKMQPFAPQAAPAK